MVIVDSIVAVFNFIYSVLQSIIDGIKGITILIYNIINLINNVLRVLPSSLYIISISFIGLYATILIYKLIRKG